jgi:hypothetical protein
MMRSVIVIFFGLLLGDVMAAEVQTLPRAQWPAWLQTKVAEYEKPAAEHAPFEIWQIQVNGHAAYYFVSSCCDQYNPIYAGDGRYLCSPSGGMTGRGDGLCPRPAEPGSPVYFVWSSADGTPQQHTPPEWP